MENNLPQLKKVNIFKKIFNKIKNILKKDKIVEQEEKNQSNENRFLESIKVDKKEDKKLLEIQKNYENKKLTLESLTDEEVHRLNLLYKRQIEELKKEIDNKKTELNMIKFRLKK